MIESVETTTVEPAKLQLSEKDEARFWARVDKREPDECWLWKGSKNKGGYGQFNLPRKQDGAHRISFQLHHRLLKPREHALHKCDTTACVNPFHLFAGSHLDNIADMVAKGRRPRGDAHHLRRHPEWAARGDKNGSRTHPERLRRGDDHYARKHPERVARGEARGTAKLTDEKVIEIRRRYAAGGVTHKELAAKFGVIRANIGLIINRKTWSHIP